MKRFLLFAILAAFSCFASAQNYRNDGKPYAYYCQIVGWMSLSSQLNFRILWNNKKLENTLCDENGNKVEFLTIVQLMNYMTKRGWEYVECPIYDDLGRKALFHYIFRKYVTNDDEAEEGLFFGAKKETKFTETESQEGSQEP